jgi:hypothetical protein
MRLVSAILYFSICCFVADDKSCHQCTGNELTRGTTVELVQDFRLLGEFTS